MVPPDARALPLSQVLASDRNELSHRLMPAGLDMDHRAAWECLREMFKDAAEDLRRYGAFDVGAPAPMGRSHP